MVIVLNFPCICIKPSYMHFDYLYCFELLYISLFIITNQNYEPLLALTPLNDISEHLLCIFYS